MRPRAAAPVRFQNVTAVTVRVPAKVNLQLSVGPLRDDGYHDLVNVFHAVSLFDEVTATPAPRLSVVVEAESGLDIDAVPVGPDNLAARAAAALAAHIGVEPAVQIGIHKAIPVAGGMAGGTAVGLGRGERLSPVLPRGRFDWVFPLADGGLSTAAVYGECDRLRAADGGPGPPAQVGGGLIADRAGG